MARPKGGIVKKAPGEAIDSRNGVRAILAKPGERVPPPTNITHQYALEAWEDYWRDPVSSLLTEADMVVLYRWVDCIDRYWRLMALADAEPVVFTNANGQMANGLYRVALQCHTSAMLMETRLGISPKSRASLGIQIVEAHTAVNQFQGRVSETSDDDDYDPRVDE